ncbi:MAG: hypothetical protein GF364_17445 [Candidatus Lokiarchaeota archaeon]|nr:hypothetical protein [Candidatus Lokiarchaeota archaeon]
MVSCHDMDEGDIYVCKECGLELKVVSKCKEFGAEDCECTQGACEDDHSCEFACCGKPLVKKA